jgi:hypothetical protein
MFEKALAFTGLPVIIRSVKEQIGVIRSKCGNFTKKGG